MTVINLEDQKSAFVLTGVQAAATLGLLRKLRGQFDADRLMAANAEYALGLSGYQFEYLTSEETDSLIMRDDVVIVAGRLASSLHSLLFSLTHAYCAQFLSELGLSPEHREVIGGLWSEINGVK